MYENIFKGKRSCTLLIVVKLLFTMVLLKFVKTEISIIFFCLYLLCVYKQNYETRKININKINFM